MAPTILTRSASEGVQILPRWRFELVLRPRSRGVPTGRLRQGPGSGERSQEVVERHLEFLRQEVIMPGPVSRDEMLGLIGFGKQPFPLCQRDRTVGFAMGL